MNAKVNDTLRFVVPMLYQPGFDNDSINNKYFRGAYIADINYPEMDGKILLVYKYEPEDDYELFQEKIESHPEFVGNYSYDLYDTIVYVFNIPDKFKDDYSILTAFRFTEISSELKLYIVKFWSVEPADEMFRIITGTMQYDGDIFENQLFNIEEDDFDDLHDQIRKALASQEAVEGLSF